MAITVSNELDELVSALVLAVNGLQDNGALNDGYHRDQSQVTTGNPLVSGGAGLTLTLLQVSAANATDLASSITLTNNIVGVLHSHMLDAQAHLLADTVNDGYMDGYAFDLTATGVGPTIEHGGKATTLLTVMNALNVAKIAYEAHRTQSGVHVNNDTGNTITAANATDQSSADTLANDLKTKINRHISVAKTSGSNSPRINIVPR